MFANITYNKLIHFHLGLYAEIIRIEHNDGQQKILTSRILKEDFITVLPLQLLWIVAHFIKVFLLYLLIFNEKGEVQVGSFPMPLEAKIFRYVLPRLVYLLYKFESVYHFVPDHRQIDLFLLKQLPNPQVFMDVLGNIFLYLVKAFFR